MTALTALLQAPAALAVFSLLAILCGVQLLLLATGKWTPKKRAANLSGEELEAFRTLSVLICFCGMLCAAGLVLGGFFGARGYWLAVAAGILLVVLSVMLRKRYPCRPREAAGTMKTKK